MLGTRWLHSWVTCTKIRQSTWVNVSTQVVCVCEWASVSVTLCGRKGKLRTHVCARINELAEWPKCVPCVCLQPVCGVCGVCGVVWCVVCVYVSGMSRHSWCEVGGEPGSGLFLLLFGTGNPCKVRLCTVQRVTFHLEDPVNRARVSSVG